MRPSATLVALAHVVGCVNLGVQIDTEVASAFKDLLAKQGMVFKMGTKVTKSAVSAEGVDLTVEPSKGGAAESINADVVRTGGPVLCVCACVCVCVCVMLGPPSLAMVRSLFVVD